MKTLEPQALRVVSGSNSMNEPTHRFYMKEWLASQRPLQTVTLFTAHYHSPTHFGQPISKLERRRGLAM
jgi:hypothetical protein